MLKHSLGNITPSKSVEKSIDDVSVKKQEVLEEMHHKALSIYATPTDQGLRYVLVEIEFDPLTGKVGKVKELNKDYKEEVIDKFKFRVDELGFFSGQLKGE